MISDLWPLQLWTHTLTYRTPRPFCFTLREHWSACHLSLITKNTWGWIRICPRSTFTIQTLSHSFSSGQMSELCLEELEKGVCWRNNLPFWCSVSKDDLGLVHLQKKWKIECRNKRSRHCYGDVSIGKSGNILYNLEGLRTLGRKYIRMIMGYFFLWHWHDFSTERKAVMVCQTIICCKIYMYNVECLNLTKWHICHQKYLSFSVGRTVEFYSVSNFENNHSVVN